MKKWIATFLAYLVIATCLAGCSSEALNIKAENYVSVNISNEKGEIASMTKAEQIEALVDCINAASFTESTSDVSQKNEQFRLSLFDAQNAATTLSVYDDSLLQVDTCVYTGDTTTLITYLNTFFKHEDITVISPVFSKTYSEISEIAFYNHQNGTFKIVTDGDSINQILTGLKSVSLQEDLDFPTTAEPTFTIYVKTNESEEYLPGLAFTQADNNLLLNCDGKSAMVSTFDWAGIYEILKANPMPIIEQ